MYEKIRKCGNLTNLFAIFIFSVIIACMGKDLVNWVVDVLLPVETVTIESSVQGAGIWIYDDGNQNNLFSACRTGEKEGIWEYRDKDSYGYTNNMIYASETEDSVKLSFSAKTFLNSYIMFWKTAEGGVITITTENDSEQRIDLRSDVEGGEMLRVYPFESKMMPVVICLAVYALLFVVVFLILLGIYYLLLHKPRRNGWLNSDAKKIYFFPVWFVLYAFAGIQYRIGIPNFLELGDQLYYWNTTLFEQGGGWNPSMLSDELLSFRGYLCNFFPSASKYIASYLDIDPVYIYFIFTSVALSWLIIIVLPGIYEVFTSKKATNFQMLLMLPVYLLFWNGTLTAILVDMFGMVAFFSGILFMFQYKQKKCLWNAFLAGMCFSIACNFRTAYQYGLILIIIILVCEKLMVFIKKKEKIKIAGKTFLKTMTGILAASAAFIILAIPQMQINLEKGHIGFLPYDFDKAWADTSIMEYSANFSLNNAYSLYPVAISDEQLLSLKKAEYQNTDSLSIPQILGVYANDPLNTLITVAKKMFVAFDTKTNVTYPSYPENVPWNLSTGFTFSFLNYFLLWSALFVLTYEDKVTAAERKLTAAFFAGLVLPQMFVHVEWRYFLATYVLLYYLFSYHFMGEVIVPQKECRKLCRSKYLLVGSTVIFISFVISITMYAGVFL